MMYCAKEERYGTMKYNRCGKSGVKLPAVSLGLWHNFGSINSYENAKQIIFRSFDLGITHFDLANNYGPVPGSAETTFGRILKEEMPNYRDEMFLSTKAGYTMWEGPYGDWGSKKYLISSLDQSLKRLQLDYVDLFYHHRPDPDTPLEETMDALAQIVRQGKALYVGLSNYPADLFREAYDILEGYGVKCLIHQPQYSMLQREPEQALFGALREKGVGCAVFSPLKQGLLTDRYLNGIPQDSRAAGKVGFLRPESVTEEAVKRAQKLNAVAQRRGQTLAQMALAWVMREGNVTTVLVGASRPEQIEQNVKMIENLHFSKEELDAIDKILSE